MKQKHFEKLLILLVHVLVLHKIDKLVLSIVLISHHKLILPPTHKQTKKEEENKKKETIKK
jgi:hypothetical protein